jgi:hypothetical protein
MISLAYRIVDVLKPPECRERASKIRFLDLTVEMKHHGTTLSGGCGVLLVVRTMFVM